MLDTGLLKRLPIWLPDVDEQKLIIHAIENAESTEEVLERLITKKQAIKQGMMQQLLSGRIRLSGFTEKWQDVELQEIACVDPETLGSGTDPGKMIDYISLEDVDRGEILGHTQLSFASAPSRARRLLRKSDVLFGTVRPNLQSHALYVGGLKRPIASTGFAVVRSGDTSDSHFVFHLLMSRLTTVQIDRIIAGSSYPAVSSSAVRKLRFLVPPLREQQAIGSILADCDLELSALKFRLAKAKAIKQGMMQELLTGRTRLPAVEAAA